MPASAHFCTFCLEEKERISFVLSHVCGSTFPMEHDLSLQELWPATFGSTWCWWERTIDFQTVGPSIGHVVALTEIFVTILEFLNFNLAFVLTSNKILAMFRGVSINGTDHVQVEVTILSHFLRTVKVSFSVRKLVDGRKKGHVFEFSYFNFVF